MNWQWDVGMTAHCNGIADGDYRCMICKDHTALGHSSVVGGPFDGRIILLHCQSCVPPTHDYAEQREAWGRVKEAITDLEVAGVLDVEDGGPGPKGAAITWHHDHFDVMP